MEKKTKLIVAGGIIGVLVIVAVWLNMSSSRPQTVPASVMSDMEKVNKENEELVKTMPQ